PTGAFASAAGESHAPRRGLAKPIDLLHQIPDAIDAVLMSPGTLNAAHDAIGRRGGPLSIVRLNWKTVYCFGWNPAQAVSAPALRPEGALRQGADAALVSLTLQS